MNKTTSYLANSQIEIINSGVPRGRIRFAIFDFDGTISLIREGWQDIMIPMMVDFLCQTPQHESRSEIERVVKDFVSKTTGKQTIYQMIQLAEEIEKRGGIPEDPLYYKNKYHDLLMDRIHERLEGLRSGAFQPVDWAVPGSLQILKTLHQRNITCFLASGTDEKYVIDEANLLGITGYFAGIYGAQDDYKNFSKRMVIQKIIRENHLSGPELVAFGDGYVEIEDTRGVGGIAVGVATNEAERRGIDIWKRDRLIASGADIIVPDFREYELIVEYLT